MALEYSSKPCWRASSGPLALHRVLLNLRLSCRVEDIYSNCGGVKTGETTNEKAAEKKPKSRLDARRLRTNESTLPIKAKK